MPNKKSKREASNPKSSTEKPTVKLTRIRYKLKPFVLQTIGISMMVIGVLLVVYPLLFDNNDTSVGRQPTEDSASPEDSEQKNSENDNLSDSGTVEDEIQHPSILDGISTVRVNAATFSASEKAEINKARIQSSAKWFATDYTAGDIGVGMYEVQLGDTLWEISEAVYGDGFQWTKILTQNSESIGFLANGSQALIVPGQILIIGK